MILPLDNFNGNSEGENVVWRKFREFLPDEYVSFHNYNIGLKEADVMLLVPNFGVLVIEIKGFLAKNIIDVPDKTIIRMKNQPAIFSPFEQAVKYRYKLIDEFLKPSGIESVYVTCAVCYPFISHDEYEKLGLNKISHEILTITKEDLVSKEKLLKKIEEIFEYTYKSISMPQLVKYGFDNDLLEKVGNLISPNFRNIGSQSVIEDKSIVVEGRKNYSRLVCVANSSQYGESEIDELIRDWSNGTKIYFYTSSHELLEKVVCKLKSILKIKGIDDKKAFKLTSNSTFLFNGDFCQTLNKDFEILNGKDYELYLADLEKLHEVTSFNKDQYLVEHAGLDNVIVKAGAGTGKTYSMISRINYLIWKKEYDADELKGAIAMITFTNESADAMKEKLADNFLNYYFLTRDLEYLSFVESVEDMNISTIHSMSKRILQAYASELGLGKDFRITSEKYNRNQILHKELNKFIINNPKFVEKLNMSMFFLSKRLESFIDKLDQKNIDIVADFNNINFGKDTHGMFDGLLEVIKNIQIEKNNQYMNNNMVGLGDLIRKLKVLHNKLKANNITVKEMVDFLFVDEFQDTDDVQIELIKSFKEIFGFKFFVVGDIKQCIYRFRGAEVKAFDTLIKNSNENIIVLSLNKNYRTDKLLMDRLNDIFIRWNSNNDIQYSVEDVLIPTKVLSDKLYFEIRHLDGKDENTFENQLISSIEKVKNQIKDNEKVAILVRENWQIAEIKSLCENHGINIETEVGGELFKIDPTIDLLKLILALKYNKSAKYLYNLYTTSYVDEELDKIELWDKSEQEIVQHFYDNLPTKLSRWNDYISRLRVEPVLKVIRDIIDDVKPWEIFSDKLLAMEDELDRCEAYYIKNLDKLFEKLVLDSNIDYLTINRLAEYLELMVLTRQEEEARASYDIENSKSKIICTTVHKSKGLEFDTVLLPYSDLDISCKRAKGDVDLIFLNNEVGYKIKGIDYQVAFQNDLYQKYCGNENIDRKLEETRILYVALTRAIRQIICFRDKTKRVKDSWGNLIEGV